MKEIIEQCDIYLNPNTLGSGIKVRNFDGLRLKCLRYAIQEMNMALKNCLKTVFMCIIQLIVF